MLRQKVQSLTQKEQRLAQLSDQQKINLAPQTQEPWPNELYGSLGQGSWEKIEFDINTKWERFSL